MVIFINDKGEEQLFRSLHAEYLKIRKVKNARKAATSAIIKQKVLSMLKSGRKTAAIVAKLSVPPAVVSAYKAHVTMGTYS